MLMLKREGARGFTIVELLIVVVIIAILAAITIVAYNGIQQRARAGAASAALSQAQKKLELYKVDTASYPTSVNLSLAGVANTGDTTYQYTSDGTTYCLTATNATVSYYVNSTTTPNATVGGCPGHGQGGVGAITNLVLDPRAVGGDWNKVVNTGAGTGSYQVTGGPSGVASTFFRLTITTPPTSAVPYLTYAGTVGPRIQPVAGQPFAVSAWVRSSRAASIHLLLVASSVGGTEWNGVISGSGVVLVANTWTRISVQSTSWPTWSTYAATRVLIETTNAVPGFWAAGDTVDVTGLMATVTSYVPNYADGSSPNWVWNGAANASTSTGPAL